MHLLISEIDEMKKQKEKPLETNTKKLDKTDNQIETFLFRFVYLNILVIFIFLKKYNILSKNIIVSILRLINVSN